MKKIEKLTTEQEARLVEFREEWRSIGLSCEPADFDAGDKIIKGFYQRLDKPEPVILHFSSPAMCELAVNFVFTALGRDSQLRSQLDSQLDSQLYRQLGSQLYSQLYRQLGSQLGSQLRSQLRSQLDSQLRSQLGSQLRSQLGSQLYSQLDSQLGSQLGSQLRSQLDSQLDSQLYRQLGTMRPFFLNNRWGSGHWCAWQALYLFAHEIGVIYKDEDISLLLDWGRLSQSIGWWSPWDGICFVSDRPRKVSFDENRLLHSEIGNAVEYSDGWGVAAWHGTRIPKDWVDQKDTIDPADILRCENVEQRAAGAAMIGWPRMIKLLDRKVLDGDPDSDMGALIELTLPGLNEPGRFLQAKCPRNGTIVEGVPHVSDIDNLPINTALAAQAWRVGDPADEYIHPEVRT